MWYWYALVAMVCFAMLQLVFAALSRRGVPTPTILLFTFGFALVLYVAHVRVLRTPLAVTPMALGALAAAAALSYVGNLCSIRALAMAPNPGYVAAIVGLQAIVLTLTSVFILGATLSSVKVLGVLLCFVGVALIVL